MSNNSDDELEIIMQNAKLPASKTIINEYLKVNTKDVINMYKTLINAGWKIMHAKLFLIATLNIRI